MSIEEAVQKIAHLSLIWQRGDMTRSAFEAEVQAVIALVLMNAAKRIAPAPKADAAAASVLLHAQGLVLAGR